MSDDVRIAAVRLDDVRFHSHNVRRDLGDLRSLADSIRRFGVMQPVVVENRGDHLRIRAGHRRVAAARIAGLTRIPAVIHSEALEDVDWLVHAVQENVMRQGLDPQDRAQAVTAMRNEGMSWAGIARAFGVTEGTARTYAATPADPSPRSERMEGLREKVDQLTREGRSAAQIADVVGLSQREVVRIRARSTAKSVPIKVSSVRTFISVWRDRPDATAADVLTSLADLAETGRLPADVKAHKQAAS